MMLIYSSLMILLAKQQRLGAWQADAGTVVGVP